MGKFSSEIDKLKKTQGYESYAHKETIERIKNSLKTLELEFELKDGGHTDLHQIIESYRVSLGEKMK
jgi:hypothetical protein